MPTSSRLSLSLLAVLLAALPFGAAPAPPEPYGTVTGRVVFVGALSPRRLIHEQGAAVRDPCCAKENLFADDLVVDPKTGGIANVCVYLPKAKAVRPKYLKKPLAPISLELKSCRFSPHVLFVREGQEVRLVTRDACPHAVRIDTRIDPVAFLLPPGKEKVVVAKAQPGRVPVVPVSCFLHPWMRGWWLVLDHPYGAVTGPDGRFTIPDLPTGRHELTVWHEKVGWIERSHPVRVRAGETTDVGQVRVSEARFPPAEGR